MMLKYSPVFGPKVTPERPGWYAAHTKKAILINFVAAKPELKNVNQKFFDDFIWWYWDGKNWTWGKGCKCIEKYYWFGIIKEPEDD